MKTKTDDINMGTDEAELVIAEPSPRTPSKVVLYGVEGVGKTTLANQFPSPLFIDTEGSTSKIQPQPSRMPDVDGYRGFKIQLNKILTNKHPYKTLVIDSIDWMEKWVEDYVCAQASCNSIEDFGYGKGYKLVEEEFMKLLGFLDRIMLERSMHILLIAHSVVRQSSEPGIATAYDRYELNLGKKTLPLIKQWADALLFANFRRIVVDGKRGEKTIAVGGKERILYCNHTAVIDAKNRFGLDDQIPMAIESLKPVLE